MDVSLGLEKFAVENGCTGGAANGVVREHCKFPVKEIAWTQPSYYCRHTCSAMNVEPGLRTVRRRIVDYRLFRSAGQLQFLRQTAELAPRGNDFFRLRRFLQLDGNGFSVAVFHRHAVAMRTENDFCRNNARTVQRAQQFA